MRPLLVSLFIHSIVVLANQWAPAQAGVPLEVSLGNETVRSQLMWLDYGNVAANTTKTVTLTVRNVSNQVIVLDVFSWSPKVHVRWSNPAPASDLPNRIMLKPGAQEPLTIDAYFLNDDPDAKMISFMTSDSEIVQIISKELVHLEPRVSKRADQSPAVFWFSGDGESWSGWYELRLHEAPPGYTLDSSSVEVHVYDIGVEGHLRRCGAWAVCEITQRDDNDVRARMTVQGHHEGGLMNTNTHVRFTAELKADYVIKQSVRLSAVNYNFLRTTDGDNKGVSGASPKEAYAVNKNFSIWELASVPQVHADPFLAPAPHAPPLASAKPALYASCENSLQKKRVPTSCVELGHWATTQADRPNRIDEASDLYTKACKSGYSRGCTELGLIGKFTSDLTTASDELKYACNMHDGLACYSLALQLERTKGTQSDPEIIALYAKACQFNFPASGCERKFNLTEGVTQRHAQARGSAVNK